MAAGGGPPLRQIKSLGVTCSFTIYSVPMTEPSPLNLPEILAAHAQPLADTLTGRRADLCGANLRDANLRDANLSYANLSYANLSYADLRDANLRDANLSYANLSYANLSYADLCDANLRDADLRGANLRDALGLAIAADAPQRLRAAAAAALEKGALEMETWHTCETTHCLGGWLIHQAGELGRLLEAATGPSMAGLMLGGIEAHSHFHDSNEAATEWLRSVLARPEVEVAS